jgi:hypothetical protein
LDSKHIKITSEETAFAAIKDALENGFGGKAVHLSFEKWPHLEIELEGAGYKSAITSPIASAIVDLQTALNRSFALEVHGTNSAAHLTDEEKSAIQFKATVEDGCTLIKVDLGKFAETLATSIINKMTPEMLVITVLGTVTLACGVVAYKAFLNARTNDKQIDAKGQTAIAMSKEETTRHKILADALTKAPQLKAVNDNFNEAKDGLMRAVSDADTLSVNDVKIDQPLARAAVTKIRTAATDIQLNGSYFVTDTNLRQKDEIRLGLLRAQDGKMFTASFKDHSLDGEQIKLLQEAEWGRSAVFLSINATELRGEINSAKVISVAAQPDLKSVAIE